MFTTVGRVISSLSAATVAVGCLPRTQADGSSNQGGTSHPKIAKSAILGWGTRGAVSGFTSMGTSSCRSMFISCPANHNGIRPATELPGTPSFSRTLRKGWVMGSSVRSMIEGAAGVQRKITSGGRRIPPFKKRRVGHPTVPWSSRPLERTLGAGRPTSTNQSQRQRTGVSALHAAWGERLDTSLGVSGV